MENFTEQILARARERQRLLKNIDGVVQETTKQNLPSPVHVENNEMEHSITFIRPDSKRSSIKLSGSPSTAVKTNTFNIQKENLNMEIKVTSSDTVQVEVEFEEANDNNSGLSNQAKDKLNRLGKLYAAEEGGISSPIHRNEDTFVIESGSKNTECVEKPVTGKGLRRLANLAEKMNNWEDDVKPRKDGTESKGSRPKGPAPKPPGPSRPSMIPETPIKNRIEKFNVEPKPQSSPTKNVAEEGPVAKALKWEKSVIESLESQGFKKKESGTKLVYDYANKKESQMKENQTPPKQIIKSSIADKAAKFESKASSPDPSLLSLSERKALFEKNKGDALVPKAPLGFSVPHPVGEAKNKLTAVKKYPAPRPPVERAEVSNDKPVITDAIRKERMEEMEVLLNRFDKNKELNKISKVDDVESEITEETAMLESETGLSTITEENSARRSGNKRHSMSPKVAAVLEDVKRIKVSPTKPGRLYPSLSDIEAATEDDRSQSTTSENSSFESNYTDECNTSFGREILEVVCKNQTPKKRTIYDESTASDVSDVLDDMDDYLDEAIAFNERSKTDAGPTPKKQAKPLENSESSHSFNYKNFKSPLRKPAPEAPPKEVEEPAPLTHTISFYRKQTNTVPLSPIRQISRQEDDTPIQDDSALILNKIKTLQQEVEKLQLTIAQTSQALNLCNSTMEFMGSTEQVEAEKVLLLATHKRKCIMDEIQRLKVEGSLRPKSEHADDLPLEQGTLTVSDISLPLKRDYVKALAAAGGKGHHVVCLVKCGEEVACSKLASTVASSDIKNPSTELAIPGSITLKNIYSDFAVTLEIYCLQAQEELLPHDVKYHIKKNGKSTPKKSKHDSLLSRPIRESPAGPQAVRSPSFALMGYVVFSIKQINKKSWTLNNTPLMSPLEGIVEMQLSCKLTTSIEHRGFLTMFEDISGFGAWHRRWCLLKGDCLSYWKYPEDEKKMPPIDSIDLNSCVTKEVGPVSREICARMHTFLFETAREPQPQDKNTLVMICKEGKTIMRHLLSADTKEERIKWCSMFNSALTALKLWGKK